MATAILTNFSTSDYPVAAGILAGAYTATNTVSLAQQLTIPAIEAAANILILRHQKSQYDDIEDRRVGYLDAAVADWSRCIDSLLDDIKDATDDVPEPAMYQPVTPAGEQFDAIQNNNEMMHHAHTYARNIGRNNLEVDIARAITLNSRYYQMNEITWVSINDLLKGELPIGVTVQSLTRSAGETFSTGRLGRHHGHYRRNMGILDYQLQKSARAEQRDERASQANHVSQLARQGDLREMMQTPQQRVGYAIQQAQLIQNSLQNAHNACARKAPFLQQQVQVKLQQCQNTMSLLAAKASLVNSFVPDFASVLNNQTQDLAKSIGGSLFNNTSRTDARVPAPIGGQTSTSLSNIPITPAKSS